jgi:hypothetical protein
MERHQWGQSHYELSFNSQQCRRLLCLPKRPDWLWV